MRPRACLVVLVLLGLGACGAGPLDAVTIDPGSLTADQVAHWTFDDGSGTVVSDGSRNGHDGQLKGGMWTPNGRFGGALELGPNEYVTVPNFPQATPAWTVSVWIRISPEQLVIDKTEEDWVTILSTENIYAGGWQLHIDNRVGFNRLDAAYWAGSSVNDYVVASCQCVDIDKWIHLTAVFDGPGGRLTVYRDDAFADGRSMPMPILPGDSTLYMGRWNMADRFLAARIDDFTIWRRALTRAEIGVLSLQPAPTPP